MKKTLFAFFAAALCATGAFCVEFTEYENSLVNQLLQIKLESRMKKSDKEALDWLSSEREKFFSSITEKISDEASLTLENLFALEEYHFMWEIDDEAPSTKNFILKHYEKVINWNDAHPIDTRSEWYNLSAYDIINTTMPLLKYSQKISLGLEEKKVYDAMIAANCQKGFLYISAGLWYSFAPAIGGGSDAKAKEYFAKAAKIGPSNYEKFFGLVYLSQVEFSQNDKASCERHLQEANMILPDNAYVPFVRSLNKAGCDALEYADDKEKVMSKVKKANGRK